MPNSVTDLFADIDKTAWCNGETHVTMSVTAVSDHGEATVLLPDVNKLNIQLIGPVTLNVTKLMTFIQQESLKLDEKAQEHLQKQKDEDVVVRCSAFYYEGAGPDPGAVSTVLMMFSIEAKGDGDIVSGFFPADGGPHKALVKFRDVLSLKRIALRVFRCPDQAKFAQLQAYAALLQPKSPALPPVAPAQASPPAPDVK